MLKQIRKLCKPAYVYLVLSAITIILMMVQNAGASGTYKVGMYQCPCNNTAGIFLGKAIYVAFWTFILDAVCKAGYKSVSWFLVLFPMILGAVLVGLVLMSGGIREGMMDSRTFQLLSLDPPPPKNSFYGFFQKLINFFSTGRFETNLQRFKRENTETLNDLTQKRKGKEQVDNVRDRVQKDWQAHQAEKDEASMMGNEDRSAFSSTPSTFPLSKEPVSVHNQNFHHQAASTTPKTKDTNEESEKHTYTDHARD